MAQTRDPLRIALHVGVYVFLCWITLFVFGGLFLWFDNPIIAATGANLMVGVFANWLAMRIFEQLHVVDVGMHMGRMSAEKETGLSAAPMDATAAHAQTNSTLAFRLSDTRPPGLHRAPNGILNRPGPV